MSCEEIKKLMSRFLDNELNETEKGILLQHISECQECREEFESLKLCEEFVKKSLAGVDFEERIVKDVLGKISENEVEESKKTYKKTGSVFAIATSFVAILLSVVSLFLIVKAYHISNQNEKSINLLQKSLDTMSELQKIIVNNTQQQTAEPDNYNFPGTTDEKNSSSITKKEIQDNYPDELTGTNVKENKLTQKNIQLYAHPFDGGVYLFWDYSMVGQQNFFVYKKKENEENFKEKSINNDPINGNFYVDFDVSPFVSYSYKVKSIDENGEDVESQPLTVATYIDYELIYRGYAESQNGSKIVYFTVSKETKDGKISAYINVREGEVIKGEFPDKTPFDLKLTYSSVVKVEHPRVIRERIPKISPEGKPYFENQETIEIYYIDKALLRDENGNTYLLKTLDGLTGSIKRGFRNIRIVR